MTPDSELIAQSKREPTVFANLYHRHAQSVYRYTAQRLGPDVADDVLSETFLVAFERRETYDTGVHDARPWLLGIATRLMRKHVRVEATAWRGLAADVAAQVAPDFIELAGARIDAERLTHRLAAALRRLSTHDRDTLLLYAWGDLDYAQIADAMEVPIGTVSSRLNRARRMLRRAAGTSASDKETEHGRIDAAAQHP